MTYIVYIPDVERGPAAYTQRSFATAADLARWAMDEALAPPSVPEQSSADTFGTPLDKLLQQMNPDERYLYNHVTTFMETGDQTMSSSLETLQACAAERLLNKDPRSDDIIAMEKRMLSSLHQMVETASTQHKEFVKTGMVPNPPTPLSVAVAAEPDWEEDTDAWFEDPSGSPWATALRERNWHNLIDLWYGELVSLFETIRDAWDMSDARCLLVSPEEISWFVSIGFKNPALFADMLFPDLPIQWAALPPAYTRCVARTLDKPTWRHAVWAAARTVFNPIVRDALQIVRLLREGARRSRWGDACPSPPDGMTVDAMAERLITAWWGREKPTDAMREYMLQVLVVRFYVPTAEATTIGSSEFLQTYMDCVRQIGTSGKLFPAAFLQWVTSGTTYKNCKSALQGLGIASVRRSDGQKYANLRQCSVEESINLEGGSCWAFADTLTGIGCGEFAQADWIGMLKGQTEPFPLLNSLPTMGSSSLAAIGV